MNRNPAGNATTMIQPFKTCSRPIAASRVRMNARCTVCDPAKPKVNPTLFTCKGSRQKAVKCVTEKSAKEQDKRDTRCRSERHADCHLVHHGRRPVAAKDTPEAWCRQSPASPASDSGFRHYLHCSN